MEVYGGKCWRQKWQTGLKFTGEIFNRFPMKVIFATVKASQYVFSQAKMEIFLRDLDPAFRRPFRYGGLHSLRRCLLQQLAVG